MPVKSSELVSPLPIRMYQVAKELGIVAALGNSCEVKLALS